MKVVVSCLSLIVLVGIVQVHAVHVKVVGEIENHQFIDRELVQSLPDLNNEVSRTFTFPKNGPLKSNWIITGYKQIDEGDSPDVQIVSGGIGSKHVSMIVTADIGKPLATTFQFYGDKIHNF